MSYFEIEDLMCLPEDIIKYLMTRFNLVSSLRSCILKRWIEYTGPEEESVVNLAIALASSSILKFEELVVR